MKQVGAWILEALQHHDNDAELTRIRATIAEFAINFPVPGIG